MDKNRIYIILESSSTNDEKRKALLEYLRYSMRKLPTDAAGRKKTAQDFSELLDTNYFADVDDGEVKYVLHKVAELKNDSEQSNDDWKQIEDLIERI